MINSTYRSLLFVPASQPRLLSRAHLRGADALIIDLEDGVADSARPAARANIAQHIKALQHRGQTVFVRINPLADGGADDLTALNRDAPLRLLLPKVRHPEQISELIRAWSASGGNPERLEVYPMIETPDSLFDARAIARQATQVSGLVFGSEDFATSSGVQTSHTALSMPAQWVALAAAAAGIAAYGLPGSLANYTDLKKFENTVTLAKSLGFQGALCIHPAQVPLCNQGFLPTAEELNWAREILAAQSPTAQLTGGARGHALGMIDPPVIARAQALIARADAYGVST